MTRSHRYLPLLAAAMICSAGHAIALDMTKPVYLAKGAIVCSEFTVAIQFMRAKIQESTNAAAARKTVDALFAPPLRHGCEIIPTRVMVRIVDDDAKISDNALVMVERITEFANHLVVFGRNLEN